ncbi:hypothetical protein VTK26DRAFT_9092 [Humicola hyalothermophila]
MQAQWTRPLRLAAPGVSCPRLRYAGSPTFHNQHFRPTPLPFLLPTSTTPNQTRPASKSAASSRWKLRQGSDRFAREARVQGLKSRAAFKLLELDAKYHLFRRGRGQVVVDLGFAPGSWSQVAADRTAPDGRVVGIDIIPAQPPRGVSTIQGNFLSPGVQAMVKRFLLEGERKRQESVKERKEEGKEKEGGENGSEAVNEVADRPSYIDLERMAARESVSSATSSSSSQSNNTATVQDSPTPPPEKPNLRLVDVVLSDMMMNTSGIAFKDHAGSMDLCRAALSFASDTLKPGGHFVCKFYQGAEDKAFEALLRKLFAKVHREKPESSRSESREAFFVALRRKGDVKLEDIEEQ